MLMKAVVTIVFWICLAATTLWLFLCAREGLEAFSDYATITQNFPAYPRSDDPEFDSKEQEYRKREQDREKANSQVRRTFERIEATALCGALLLGCVWFWLFAVLTGATRRRAVRLSVNASMWGAIALPAGVLGLAILVDGWSKVAADARVVHSSAFVATVGALVGGGAGAAWAALFRKPSMVDHGSI